MEKDIVEEYRRKGFKRRGLLSGLFFIGDANAPQEGETCGLAITSLVLGVISLVGPGPFTAIPGVILGHLSMARIYQAGGKLKGNGLAIAGLVTGYVALSLTVSLLLYFFVISPEMERRERRQMEQQMAEVSAQVEQLAHQLGATLRGAAGSFAKNAPSARAPRATTVSRRAVNTIPHVVRTVDYSADIEKNEKAVMVAFERIVSAQERFKSSNGHYAGTLRSLPVSENELSVSGYRMSMMGSTENFRITALPEEHGKTGRRSFYADETGVIRANTTMRATKNDAPATL